METWKLIIIGILVFSPYLLRADFIGADPYYYLTQVCNGDYSRHENTENLFTAILPFFQCNLLQIKLILMGLFIINILIIQEIGKLFKFKYSGLLILLSPVLILESMRFENEAFAMPFLLAGLFYFLKWRVKYQDSKKLILPPFGRNEREKWGEWSIWGAFSYLIVGLAFWKGAIIYFVGFLLPWSIIPVVAYSLYEPSFIFQFLPNITLLEGFPGLILGGGLLFTGILAIPKELKPQIWFFIALAILKLKFLVYALPFLVLGLEKRIIDKYGKIPRFVYVIPFIWTISILLAPPTGQDWEIVDQVKELTEKTGKPVFNEWGRGYWYHYKDLDVNYYGWEDPTRIKCGCPGICVKENTILDC